MPTVTGQNVYIASDSVNFRTGEVTKANISYNSGSDKLFFSGDLVFQDPTASITGRLEVSHIEVTGAHNPWAGTDTQYGAIYLSDEGRGLLGNFGGGYARPMITANSNKLTIGSNGTNVIRDIDVHPGNGAGAAMSNFNVFTSGVKRMTVTRTGNIGFGGGLADNPNHAFVVDLQDSRMDILNGSVKIRYAPNNDAITLTPSVGNEARILASDGDTSSPHPLKIAADQIRFTTSGVSASTEVMRITSDGKVGIGTNDPTTAKLRIKGTTNDSSELTLQCIDSTDTQTFFVRNDGVVQVTDNYFYVSSNAGAYVQHDLRVRGSLSNDGGALVVGGDVNFDVNTLFVDSTNDRVGIGTNTPDEKLHVEGSANGNVKALIENTNVGSSAYATLGFQNNLPHSVNPSLFLNGTNNTNYAGANSLNMYHYGAYNLGFVTNNLLRMTVSGNGNVGIGTNTPRTTLHVSKAGTTEGAILTIGNPNNTDGSYCGIEFINSAVGYPRSAIFAQRTGGYDAELTFHTSDANLITGTDYPDATERMRIDHDGNIGIGTNNPDRKVVIDAGAGYPLKVNSTQEYLMGLARNGTEQWWFKVNTAGDFTIHENAADDRFRIKTGGDVGIGTASPARKLDVSTNAADAYGIRNSYNASYYMEMAHNRFNAVGNNYIRFNIDDATKMTIVDSDFGGGVNGVGIGITNPTAELQVIGNISGSGNFLGTGVGSRITAFNGKPYLVSGDEAGATNTLQTVTDNGATTTNALALNNGVAIEKAAQGVISASRTDAGTAAFTLSASNGDSQITFLNLAASKFSLGNDATNNSFRISEGAILGTNDRFVILNGGNVGIGTNAPSGVLDVGGDGADIFLHSNDFKIARIQPRGSSTNYDRGLFSLFNQTVEAVRIDSYGPSWFNSEAGNHLGIGTVSPGKQVEIRATEPYLRLEESDSGGNKRLDLFVSQSTGVIAANQSAQTMMFQTIGENRMTIEPAGNVGIGTTNPTNLLHVDGKSKLGTNGFSEGGFFINYATLSETKGGASTILGNAVYAGTTSNTFRRTKGDAGNFIALNYNKGITFHTNVTGNTTDDYDINNHEQMRITTAGDVGIGSNAPDAHLNLYNTGITSSVADVHIVGSGNSYGLLVERLRNDSLIVSKSTTAGSYFKTDSATTSYQGYEIGTNWFIGQYGYNDLRIVDGGKGAGDSAAALTIQDSTKYIGIGTTAPEAYLSIVNTAGIVGMNLKAAADNLCYIDFGDSSDNNIGGINYNNSDDTLNFRAGNMNRVTIDSAGNVGIGTNVPGTTFDLRGNMRLDSGGGTDRSIYFRNQATVGKVRSDAALQFDVGVSSSPSVAMYIQEDTRYVGIGTNNPASLLELHKYGAGSSTDLLNVGGTGNGRMLVRHIDGKSSTSASAQALYLNYISTSSVSIAYGGGNVGIGTHNPSSVLHVHGSDPVIKVTDTSASDNGASLFLQETDDYGVKLTYDALGSNLDFFSIDTKYVANDNNVLGDHTGAWGIDRRGNVRPHKGAVDGNLLRAYEWHVDGTTSSGSLPFWGMNGSTDENQRITGKNPFGEPAILWANLNNDGNSGPDGGWNTDTFVIDRRKQYRTSVWIRKDTASPASGHLYLGTRNVDNISNGAFNSNPYFLSPNMTQTNPDMVSGRWYLFVGYIHPSGTAVGNATDDGGVYDRDGTKIMDSNLFRWTSSGSLAGVSSETDPVKTMQRVYSYYDGDPGSKTFFWCPRFEPMEASTPTLQELLNTPSTDVGAFFGGNVGIGTTKPSTTNALDVVGNVAFDEYIYHRGDEDTNIKFVDDDIMFNVGGATFLRLQENSMQNQILINSDTEDTDFAVYGNNANPALFMRGSDREIGINTTNPTASLHVVGNARIKGSSSDGVLSMENAAGSQTLRIDQNSIRTSTNNNLTFLTNGNSNSLVLQQSTNYLGIGAVPTSAFHVNTRAVGLDGAAVTTMTKTIATSTIGAKLSFTGGSNTTNNIIGGLSMGNVGEEYAGMYSIDGGGSSTTHLAFFAGNSTSTNEGMRLLSDGKVGIGSSAPAAFLDVSKDNSNAGHQFVVADTEGATAAIRTYATSDPAGLIINHYYAEGGSSNEYARYADFVSNVGNGAGTKMRFITKNAANTYFTGLLIDNSGKVGIGTSNPSDFHSNANKLVVGDGAGAEGITIFSQDNNAGYLYFADGTAGDAAYRGFLQYSHSTNNLSLGTAGGTKLTITSAGNVGIGSASPTEKLDVAADTDVSAAIGKAHVGLVGSDTDVAGFAHVDSSLHTQAAVRQTANGQTKLGCASSQDITFFQNNNQIGGFNTSKDFFVDSDTLYVDVSEEKVGIGSNAPAETLDVVGLIRFAHTRANNTQKIARLLVPEYNNSHGQFLSFMGTANETSNAVSYGGGTSAADAATLLLFYTASAVNTTVGTERMRITHEGRVGIGTNAPGYKLEVNGSIVGTSKSFLIDHPTQTGKKLMHACIEGPENGVYFRGRSQETGIQAPEYWSGLVDIDSMTVDVTPIGPNQSIYVDRIDDNGDICVGSNTNESLNYFYVVYGERKDIDKLEVVKDAPPPKTGIA
jgi:hypothetical protein